MEHRTSALDEGTSALDEGTRAEDERSSAHEQGTRVVDERASAHEQGTSAEDEAPAVAVVSSALVDVLLDTDAVRITRDPVARVVRLTRTSKGHDTVADFETSTDAFVRALAPVNRTTHVLLLDTRLAPMRGGDDFDLAAQRFGREVCAGFARVAVLVATQVGRLQIARFEKDHGGPRPFFDEAEAMQYLMAK